jgi:hypothetical protein
MDYSSAADVPISKAFDNIIETDKRGNFMVDNSAKCFNACVPNIKESEFSELEAKCIKDCYAKSYYAFSLNNH